MMTPKDFQINSAKRIVSLFENGQRRVLLADEVGLGKTIVAREVVRILRERAIKNGKSFNVIYVCSNQGIIKQNAHKLGIKRIVKLSESRLSMQHKVLYELKKNEETETKGDDDYLIPITPLTSLIQTNSYGNANERSLIFSLICDDFTGEGESEKLKEYLDVYAKRQDGEFIHTSEFDSPYKLDSEYKESIRQKLCQNNDYKEIVSGIKDVLGNDKDDKQDRKHINKLRTLFSKISMDMLNPDFVIMDEFQRYRDIMKGGKNTEENRLAQSLFNAKSNPNILLISATPYKPLTTMEEISESGKNENFEDFKELVKFLLEVQYGVFDKKWQSYSDKLGTISTDKVNELIASKKEVEECLRNVIVRNERYTPNLVKYDLQTVFPEKSELDEYALLRKLLSKASEISEKSRPIPLNIDYVKSSPLLLSFMQQYVEKTNIENAFNRPGPKKNNFKDLLLKYDNIEKNEKLNCSNARLNKLMKMLFKDADSYNLLWMPASIPYYNKTGGVFERHSDFSKVLVFSKWGFVPRMLATMLSYEASRLAMGKQKNNGHESNALEKYKELLLSPFPYLAGLFTIKDRGSDLPALQSIIRERVYARINELNISKEQKSRKSKSYKELLNLVRFLDGDCTINKKSISINDEFDIPAIVNIIIASPGVCLYRCFDEDYGSLYEKDENKKNELQKFGSSFVNMLGYDESQKIIHKNIKEGPSYFRTLEYCVMGNLQSVLDEYSYVLGYCKDLSDTSKQDLWEILNNSIITRVPLDVDTDKSFCIPNVAKTSIRRWYACDYAKVKNTDDQASRKFSVQSAFNSPFRPFVLASTSVGQEGLDFHLYCRKIVHWNLPANPVNLEQRSGRINRYEGLAIRRSIAHLFNERYSWDDLFAYAEKEWKSAYVNYNQMMPFWCLPKEIIEADKNLEKSRLEYIENLFFLYPFSVDGALYSNLRKQLSLYRLTMGQPDQEFIIDVLDKLKLTQEQIDELTFHLNP